ncbi:hypothetical protein BGX27_007708 [Mortierella sp. AM989]|nr:hypothetical protein BGX27_007708 [Mortierella sp. AM989]
MSSWCRNEPWGPYTNDTLDFTPCFREIVLETTVPLTFLILTVVTFGARPLLERCIEIFKPKPRKASSGAGPSVTSSLLGHPQDQNIRQNGYNTSSYYSNGSGNANSSNNSSTINNNNNNNSNYNNINQSSDLTANNGSIVKRMHINYRVSKFLLKDESVTEDASLLLQPKDHSDKDPRPESFVNHPTNSDIILILVTLVQALGFLALVLVRWRFMELGGRHGQPGHIHLPAYRFIMPVVQSLTWSYVFVLCILSGFTRLIVKPSRIRRMLLVFAIFTFINSMIRMRTNFRCYGSKDHTQDDIPPEMHQRYVAELILAAINAILSTIFAVTVIATSKGADVYYEGRKVSSEINASFLSWVTFNWMNKLMWDGYARTHELEFLPSLTEQMRARPVYRIFARTRLYFQEKRRPSLLWRIYITNRWDIWINFIFGVISSIVGFGVPFFASKLLNYISDREEPKEIAYFYVFGMLISDVIRSLTFGQNLYYGRRVDVRLRAMLGAEVYAKALRRKDMTGIVAERAKGSRSDTGMIVNLMAVDTNSIASMGSSVFFLYTCPIEIIISIVMLYNILGISSLVGLSVMVLTFPLHHYAAKKYARIQEQMMEARDRRVGLMSELLQGIRMIKFFTWENNIRKKIMEVRDQELRRFIRLYIINTFFTLLWFGSPILVTVVAFTSYTKLEHKVLTAPVAFTSMIIFFILRSPLNILPGMITELLVAMVSIKRVEAFLSDEEIPRYSASTDETTSTKSAVQSPAVVSQQIRMTNTIGFTNATLKWHTWASATLLRNQGLSVPSSNTNVFTLRNLTINFPVGKLSLVCGATGSGKTSLLMGLLREMDLISGSIDLPMATTKVVNPNTGYIPGTLAYVSQYPWLQQASIRDNVLFGSPFEVERYQHVLEACALLPDIATFEHGDLTEIGENGITLSGGQKQRVALARAMYSRAQHLFFDDCLSAVDSHTARHLFENCLKGSLMNGRTRILVTHHIRLCLRDATYVVLLKDGALALTGTPVKLIRSGLLSEILERNGMMEEENSSSNPSTLAPEHGINYKDPSLRNAVSPKLKNLREAKKLVDEEARSRGNVKLMVYNAYLKACGGAGFWIVLIFMLFVSKFLGILEFVWIKAWASNYDDPSMNRGLDYAIANIGILRRRGEPDEDEDEPDLDFFIGIYGLISLMTVFLTIVRMFWQFYGSLKASRSLYEELLVSIIHAPIRFFDTTPVGRIINRFSKDFEVIDGQLISLMVAMFLHIFGIAAVVFIISWVTPGFLIVFALIAMAYLLVGAYYISSSRELKRLESVTKSPLYSHFGDTLVGVSTIRAFGVESRFMEEVLVKLDNHNAPFYFLWMCNRWLSIRVDFMGSMVTFVAGILILLNLEFLDASWAGLSLAAAVNFMNLIYWLVRIYTETEMSLNSVERVNEYLDMPQEPAAIIPGSRPPASWPFDGKIEINDLTMQYAPDLGPVLFNISINIRPREKIGIVGRTGSGKSTLALSLFRLMEPTAGSIVIDGIDISKIGLEDLRRRLTIIPQDAVLFNGTIRSNLDPFQEHTDYEIWEALRRVHLVKARGSRSGSASSLPPGLNSAFYQNHQSTQHPSLVQHPDEALDMNGYAHPRHHYHVHDHTFMNPDAIATNYENGTYCDPFHPAAVIPGSPSMLPFASQCGYVHQQTESGMSTPLLSVNGLRPNSLLPIDAMSPKVLCSSLNHEATESASEARSINQSVLEPINPFENLDSPVSDGGYNFSQGQRQLLCIARALLRESKVIVMDEATASVDFATDEKIQATIRNELGDSTLITVAHRLRTIMDYDRVLVLEQGRLLEFDSPINLITNPSSRFRDMVEKSGEVDALFEMAAKAY